MSNTLALTLKAGQSVTIGSVELKVVKIYSTTRCKILVDAPYSEEYYEIDNKTRTSVLSNVEVQLSKKSRKSAATILFHAPKNILILRKSLFDKQHSVD